MVLQMLHFETQVVESSQVQALQLAQTVHNLASAAQNHAST